MMRIEKRSGVPVYRQIMAMLEEGIRAGTLERGSQLPTERELAAQMGVSRGTVKRAYDELNDAGVLEGRQGIGTFVAGGGALRPDAHARAQEITDRMLGELSALPLSRGEIEALVHAKLQRGSVRIAFADPCPETLEAVRAQLAALPHADVSALGMGALGDWPPEWAGGPDLMLTDDGHYLHALERLGGAVAVERVAVTLPQKARLALLRIPQGASVGVYGASGIYVGRVLRELRGLGHGAAALLAGGGDVADFLRGLDVLVLPTRLRLSLVGLAGWASVIPLDWMIDSGSMLHVKAQVESLYEDKQKGT